MNGIKNFIAGFSLSLISMSFAGQLYSPLPPQKQYPARDIKIDLFKRHDTFQIEEPLFKKVSKYSVISTAKTDEAAMLPKLDTTNNINGIEDDEILSVNIDGLIPIDYEISAPSQQVEIVQDEADNLAAMLPEDTIYKDTNSEISSPWEVAKSSRHVKNKKLLEEFNNTGELSALADNIDSLTSQDKEISYKVAEKIKQSIIFPIPSEILNDENLTPTFIKGHKKTSSTSKTQPTTQKQALPQQVVEAPKEVPVRLLDKTQTKEAAKNTDSKGLLDSLSSWLVSGNEKEEKKLKTQKAPSYGSQTATNTNRQTPPSSNEEFANFYETLQETTRSHQQDKVLPSELKLSFQPNRAEISGQTLRWLKAFSEAAQNEGTYLQVRLDASTPADIQRKRLNLLYSIFINNGVDVKKIDTVFSSTEPNAFIIRSLIYN